MIIVNGLLYVYTSNTCIDSCNHHHNQDTGQFQHLKSSLWCPLWCPFVVSLPAQPQPLVITDLFILSFLECHGSGTLQYATLFIYLFIHSFIHSWLRWVFVAARGLSLVAASGGYSLLWCAGFSLQWLLLWSTGFSSCGTRAQ